MQINCEAHEQHSIQAYNAKGVQINNQWYEESIIVHPAGVRPWPVHQLHELNEELLSPLLHHQPKIILIGHDKTRQTLPLSLLSWLSQQKVGLEVMALDAAYRTFNVLLSENREVILGIIK